MRLKLRFLFWMRAYFQTRCREAKEKVWAYDETIEADLNKHNEPWPGEEDTPEAWEYDFTKEEY